MLDISYNSSPWSRRSWVKSYVSDIKLRRPFNITRKTQLATRFVFGQKVRKSGASIFWVSALNADEIAAGFQKIADELSLVRKADGSADYERPNLRDS